MIFDEGVQLNLIGKDHWWDVAREINPQLDREQFDKDWAEFTELKKRKALS